MSLYDDARAALLPRHAPNVMAAECPSRRILSHVTSRWGVLILIALRETPLRFSALRRRIGGVSERMLAQTLQTLEADGFILREVRDVVPPHVSYSLTPLGREVCGHVAALAGWIEVNLDRIPGAARPGPERDSAGQAPPAGQIAAA